MDLHRCHDTINPKNEISELDGTTFSQGSSKTCVEYVQEIKTAANPSKVELSAQEIQAEIVRLEEKNDVEGYNYGNSWAKLV